MAHYSCLMGRSLIPGGHCQTTLCEYNVNNRYYNIIVTEIIDDVVILFHASIGAEVVAIIKTL